MIYAYNALMIVYLGFSLAELINGNKAQAVYWLGASVITLGVLMSR